MIRWSSMAAVLMAAIIFATGLVHSEIYYIGTEGSDSNEGTQAAPFGTFEHAIGQAGPGDTIFVKGGLYSLSSSIVIDKAGEEGRRIKLHAVEGEEPVLDFKNHPRHSNRPQPRENDSIAATGDAVGLLLAGGAHWWHIKGLTVQDAPYYGVRIYGSQNIVEQLKLHGHNASGLEITGKEGHRPSHNLVLNCDSFRNFDPQTNGEDADGFGVKFKTVGPGNVLRGTRAWANSDDGYDTWACGSAVTFDQCWAWGNGFNRRQWRREIEGEWRGDGNGFKLGQQAGPHTLKRVVAFRNKGIGIFENGNDSEKGLTVLHATAYNNGKKGGLQVRLRDGRPHTIKNSVAIDTEHAGPLIECDSAVSQVSNTWNGSVSVSRSDFRSLSPGRAVGPRPSDGSLPESDFLRLASDSDWIDAGVDVGLPYNGEAPDLGAFETSEGSSRSSP